MINHLTFTRFEAIDTEYEQNIRNILSTLFVRELRFNDHDIVILK